MKRSLLVLVALAMMMTMAAAPAGADSPNELAGRWLAIDVEGSFWQVTFSASGRFNSIDSATIPCEGYRTREWGAVEKVGDNQFVASSWYLKCLEGPLEGTVFDLPGGLWIYDPVTDTILQLNPEPFRDVTFCRRPCDPYDYVP